MIYTVTFNPSLDYVVDVEGFRIGVVNRTKHELIFPGGKGINVSMVLRNLGHESTAWGFLAGFTGEEIEKRLQDMGIATDFIRISNGCSRINVKLRSGEETEINGQGPGISTENIRELYRKFDCLTEEDILILAGSIPHGMSDTLYMDIMKYLQHRQVRVVVDATKNLLVHVLQYRPFLIKPNNYELGELFGAEVTDKQQVVCYARKLQDMGAKNVLVSMAGDGAVLLTEHGEIYQSEAPKGMVVNSVGAGDSMVAGFLAGYLQSEDYKDAFKMGVCTGSASAFSEELATKDEVDRLMKSHCFGF